MHVYKWSTRGHWEWARASVCVHGEQVWAPGVRVQACKWSTCGHWEHVCASVCVHGEQARAPGSCVCKHMCASGAHLCKHVCAWGAHVCKRACEQGAHMCKRVCARGAGMHKHVRARKHTRMGACACTGSTCASMTIHTYGSVCVQAEHTRGSVFTGSTRVGARACVRLHA